MQETPSQTIDDVIRSGEDQAQNKIKNARERITEVTQRATEKGSEAWKDTVDLVKRHPAQSLGIALAAGAALGALAVVLFSRDDEPAYSKGLKKAASSGKDSWNNFRSSFDKGIEGLSEAVDQVKSSFR